MIAPIFAIKMEFSGRCWKQKIRNCEPNAGPNIMGYLVLHQWLYHPRRAKLDGTMLNHDLQWCNEMALCYENHRLIQVLFKTSNETQVPTGTCHKQTLITAYHCHVWVHTTKVINWTSLPFWRNFGPHPSCQWHIRHENNFDWTWLSKNLFPKQMTTELDDGTIFTGTPR